MIRRIELVKVVFYLLHEHLCGLECGDAVLGDDDGCVLGDVACSLL